MQRLGRFQIWQLFLPTAARIIAGTSASLKLLPVASTQVHVILLTVCNFTEATYFRVGIHMCSGLGSLKIFLNCPEEWGL